MANPKRLDIARAVGDLSPARKDDVAESLGVSPGSKQFEERFEEAASRGLIEPHEGGGGDGDRWTITDKGRRRLGAA